MNNVACLEPIPFEQRTNSLPRITSVRSQNSTYESVVSRPWESELLREANKLFSLEHGWDSYGAEPIPIETILSALNTLMQVLTDSSPAPRLVPGSSGSVQAEWCLDDLDVEVEFSGSTDIRVWYEDKTGPHEAHVDKNIEPLLSVVQRLSEVGRTSTY